MKSKYLELMILIALSFSTGKGNAKTVSEQERFETPELAVAHAEKLQAAVIEAREKLHSQSPVTIWVLPDKLQQDFRTVGN